MPTPISPIPPIFAALALACVTAAAVAQPSGIPAPAGVQITTEYGIEFVTVGDAGNAAWPGNPAIPSADYALGRGSVGYEYRIGRFEMTLAQWIPFFNAAYDRPGGERIPWTELPTAWSAVPVTPTHAGGQRWAVPAGRENELVGNISWRMAAVYCNWLHNEQRLDRAAFLTGAYDVSTFGTGTVNRNFTDQLTRSPGARFFIPTWDEWLKAAHYDPNRFSPGQGGWWRYSTSSDTAPIGGPPGVGQANYGFSSGGFTERLILLGSYPTVQSPWGLLDAAGGTGEWTEGVLSVGGVSYRQVDGSFWGTSPSRSVLDSITTMGGILPNIASSGYGFRIASVVPSPGSGLLVVLVGCVGLNHRRRERKCG